MTKIRRSQRLAAARAKAIAVAAHSHNQIWLEAKNGSDGREHPTNNSSYGSPSIIKHAIVSLRRLHTLICCCCGVVSVVALACRSNSIPLSPFAIFSNARQVGAEVCKSSLMEHEQQQIGNTMWNGYWIPPLLSPFGDYPNPLGFTDEDRKSFHPVVMFPKIWADVPDIDSSLSLNSQRRPKKQQVWNVQVLDGTNSSGASLLATEQMREERRLLKRPPKDKIGFYAIGRYDENRVGLYTSDLFQNSDNSIGGFSGARTLHVGIDLDGPVGTKVYSFADGIIHAAGYNPDLGDYGNVIVVEHELGTRIPDTTNISTSLGDAMGRQKFWALYGHLDDKSLKGKKVGKRVRKGQALGGMGDIHENGGWMLPHVHFQLSIHPPATHDLPGAVALKDRPRALIEYPDPRWVLGPLY